MIASRTRNPAAANRPMLMPPALTETLSSDLASSISLLDQGGDVPARVDDQLADRGLSSVRDGLTVCHG